ncbi:MAG: hypothetical protein ACLTZH_10000 [Subdoligranulum sp.]
MELNLAEIADTLNLFGYDNFNRFMAINNSQRNDDNTNGSKHTYYAYQGLVADTTSNGNADGAPLLNGTTTVEPHFNKEFLLGENSKKAKLGEVYDNVKFPFTQKEDLCRIRSIGQALIIGALTVGYNLISANKIRTNIRIQ